MKKLILLLIFALSLPISNAIAQSNFTQKTLGHEFKLSLPDYMSKTRELHDVATIQYMNDTKGAFLIAIYDDKEELKAMNRGFGNINDYADFAISKLIENDSTAKVSEIKSLDLTLVKGISLKIEKTFEQEEEIIYIFGVYESAEYYYQVICWTTKVNFRNLEKDYNQILQSFQL